MCWSNAVAATNPTSVRTTSQSECVGDRRPRRRRFRPPLNGVPLKAFAPYRQARRRYLSRWITEESPSLADIAATACSFVERGQARLTLSAS